MCNNYEQHVKWREYCEMMQALALGTPTGQTERDLPRADDIRINDLGPVMRAAGNGIELATMQFGFPPSSPKGGPVFNFRSEGRRFDKSHRCLVPASAFFEFTGAKYPKAKHRFTLNGAPFMAIAGLWREGVGNQPAAFTMLTTEPGPDVAPYHNRQIVVLRPKDWSFPESHAASFALIAYASSWLKCWHPDVFCAALLNAQPMGFYAPAQIVRDARYHGVEVRSVCVNASRWDCTLEPVGQDEFAVRLGMRMVRGLANADAAKILAGRADRTFASVDDLWRRSEAPVTSLVELAKADAFGPALGIARREALWAIKALRDEPLPLFAAASAREAAIVPEVSEEPITLKPMTAGREVVEDYGHVGLTLREHPVSFLRRDLAGQKVLTCADAGATRDGRAVKVAGLVLVRQKPGSAKGVMFITIEDETGVANLVIWPSLYEKQRRVILTAGMLRVDGRVQREGEVVHVVAHQLHDLSVALASVGDREGSFPLPHGRGDEFHHGSPGHDPRDQPPRGVKPRDIYIPDLSLEAIRVRTRDFR